MKKLFLLAVLAGITMGCASSNKTTEPADTQYDAENAKYQIIDQEFDNLVVPNDHYNQVAPYEDQISGSSYIKSSTTKNKKTTKSARQVKTQTTVVDGNGNVLSGSYAPVTDEEALPDEYTRGEAY